MDGQNPLDEVVKWQKRDRFRRRWVLQSPLPCGATEHHSYELGLWDVGKPRGVCICFGRGALADIVRTALEEIEQLKDRPS
jgi:hypothetical protein